MKNRGKKLRAVLFACVLAASACVGCGGKAATDAVQSEDIPADGSYLAQFHTDSGMFCVNEADEGLGELTVSDGEMVIHVSLKSKNIVHLYLGLAEDAPDHEDEWLNPTTDSVTYSDGITEEVYGYDIPVPVLGGEFDLAIIGTKGTWYDHRVSVTDPVAADMGENDETAAQTALADGVYTMELTFVGGSGKAKIGSPATVTVDGDSITAVVTWNSPNYDYMLVDGEKYLPVNTEGNSVFEIPVAALDQELTVVGDTVAMSKPHEITYTLTFHSDTAVPAASVDASALVYEGSTELSYATGFSVDFYEGGYRMLTTLADGARFLVVPQGKTVPDILDEDVVVLQQPVSGVYLVASAVMDMFCALDCVDAIRFSGQQADGWYVEEARDAMERGDMVYAGKYSMPDYELIVSGGCTLAIENMMISHSPEVIEKLAEFGIPTMIDYSSYEEHPLGRAEWVKFYGALLGKDAEAEELFAAQAQTVEAISEKNDTGQTVAFFFVTSNGTVNVRKATDYVPQMIALAGGHYCFDTLGVGDDSRRSSVNLTMEDFYATAKDADYLIYNSTIDGELRSLSDLLDKCPILRDFRAVKEQNVWCTTNDMYQHPMSAGDFITDLRGMLDGKLRQDAYLYQLF